MNVIINVAIGGVLFIFSIFERNVVLTANPPLPCVLFTNEIHEFDRTSRLLSIVIPVIASSELGTYYVFCSLGSCKNNEFIGFCRNAVPIEFIKVNRQIFFDCPRR